MSYEQFQGYVLNMENRIYKILNDNNVKNYKDYKKLKASLKGKIKFLIRHINFMMDEVIYEDDMNAIINSYINNK